MRHVSVLHVEMKRPRQCQGCILSVYHGQPTSCEEGYHRLDEAFRNWLLSINASQDEIAIKMSEWLLMAKKVIFHRGENLLEECSEEALTGFIKQDNDNKSERINAFGAFQKFKENIIRILG